MAPLGRKGIPCFVDGDDRKDPALTKCFGGFDSPLVLGPCTSITHSITQSLTHSHFLKKTKNFTVNQVSGLLPKYLTNRLTI